MLEPAPAFVLNRLSNLLAWTSGYERLAGPIGILDGDRPNLVRFTFTDVQAQTAYPEWDAIADEQVANLQSARRPGDDEGAALVDDEERLVVYLPADEAATAAFDRLNGRRPGGLRAISG